MQIFKAEASAGLEEVILKNSVLAYTMPITPWVPDIKTKEKILASKSIAGMNDYDLYYTRSVLVTSNWNLNDDVFDPEEVWAARYTPVHKPTNIEHKESQIVGHITECWASTSDGQLIPDNTSIKELPEVFDLVNGAVIYRHYSEPELQERTNTLISEIEAGKKSVSMECLFSNFDYAVQMADGSFKIVPRNEASAFLTKHLRAYGGSGKYEDNKIGRLLRNITFSGKGYVNNPANPESIIFQHSGKFNFSSASIENPFILNSGVLNNSEQNIQETENMSQELQDKIAELEQQLAAAQLALNTQKTEADNAYAEKDKVVADLQAKLATVEASYSEKIQLAETLQAKIDEMTKAQITASRISTLTLGGLDKEMAEKKVALYAGLSDEQFADIANDIVEAAKMKKDMEKKEEPVCPSCGKKGCDGKKCKAEEDTEAKVCPSCGKKGCDGKKCKAEEEVDANEDNADAASLENVETPKTPDLAVANEIVNTDDIRQELQKVFAAQLGINIEEKKE